MTDLVRRALLGDREAQAECTRQGIVLPCPFCGEGASVSYNTVFGFCVWCGDTDCILNDLTHGYHSQEEALAAWNTRNAPPIVRCGECKHWHKEHCTRGPSPCCTLQTPADYYCPYGEPKEDPENEAD